jgi:nitrite reductase/ring-hydroxylating ferredoxin subunit
MVWSIVGKIADFGPGTLREVHIDGRTYAIANMDGTLFAIDGICGHAGDNMGSGKLIGAKVKSPVRGSVYDLRTERTLKAIHTAGQGSRPSGVPHQDRR